MPMAYRGRLDLNSGEQTSSPLAGSLEFESLRDRRSRAGEVLIAYGKGLRQAGLNFPIISGRLRLALQRMKPGSLEKVPFVPEEAYVSGCGRYLVAVHHVVDIAPSSHEQEEPRLSGQSDVALVDLDEGRCVKEVRVSERVTAVLFECVLPID